MSLQGQIKMVNDLAAALKGVETAARSAADEVRDVIEPTKEERERAALEANGRPGEGREAASGGNSMSRFMKLRAEAKATAQAIRKDMSTAVDSIGDMWGEIEALDRSLNNARMTGIGLGGGFIKQVLLKEVVQAYAMLLAFPPGKDRDKALAKLKNLFNAFGGNFGGKSIEQYAKEFGMDRGSVSTNSIDSSGSYWTDQSLINNSKKGQ